MLIFSEEEAFSPLTSRTYSLLTFLVLGLRCPKLKFHSKSSFGKGDATYLIILLRLGERSFLKENLGVIIKSGENGSQAGKNKQTENIMQAPDENFPENRKILGAKPPSLLILEGSKWRPQFIV